MGSAVKPKEKVLPVSPWILTAREEFTTLDLVVLFFLVQPRRKEIS
jgi:hypothetical protein